MPLILRRRGLLRRPSSPFAFPGTSPGFDPNHIASAGIAAGHGISVAPLGANFVSLLTGQKGTIAGNTAFMDAQGGPMITQSANNSCSFSGQSTANDANGTIAGIVRNISSTGNALSNGVVATNGWGLVYNGTQLRVRYGVSTYTTVGSTLNANEAYFVAVSFNGSICNFVKVRLLTGETVSEQIAGSIAAVAPDGTYRIGTSGSATGAVTVGAAMLSANYLSKEQLRQWAADPWSFWYPR